MKQIKHVSIKKASNAVLKRMRQIGVDKAERLQNIQKLEDGEMLAGGSTAEEDFGGDNEWSDDDMM